MSKKIILVTGGTSGMGAYMVKSLAAEGHRVYAGMRDSDGRNAELKSRMVEHAKATRHDIRVLALDVLDQSSVNRALDTVMADNDRIDVLINNAGLFYVGVTEAFTIEQVRVQMETNFIAPMRMYRAVLPFMHRQQEGLIINTSSVAGRLVFPFMGIYCASKYALEAAVEAMRYELSGSGIDSILIEPGPFNTGLINKTVRANDTSRATAYGALADVPEAMIQGFEDFMKSHPKSDPQHIADVVVELVALPYGQRPLRTSLGTTYGVCELNKLAAPLQAEALQAMQFGHLDPNQPAQAQVA